MRGAVFIAPVGHVPHGRMVEPESVTFHVSWQDDAEDLIEDDEIHGAEAAVAWGRQRSKIVIVRLGHSDGTSFSAGDVPSGRDLPVWPPSAAPSDGWWRAPDPPTLAEVELVAAGVADGSRSPEEAVRWASDRLHSAMDVGSDLQVIEALCELTAGWEIHFGVVRRLRSN